MRAHDLKVCRQSGSWIVCSDGHTAMNFFKAGVSPAEAAIRDAVFKATTPAGAGEGDPAALVGLLQLLSQGGSLQSEMCIKHVKSRIKSEDAAVQVTSLVVLDRLLQLGDPRSGTSILAPLCLHGL